jgi:hypothetical protein
MQIPDKLFTFRRDEGTRTPSLSSSPSGCANSKLVGVRQCFTLVAWEFDKATDPMQIGAGRQVEVINDWGVNF